MGGSGKLCEKVFFGRPDTPTRHPDTLVRHPEPPPVILNASSSSS